MIKGFGGASIWSQDLNNLLPFYRDTLGLKPTLESERVVLFGDPNAPSLGLGSHSEVKGKNNDPARHMVGLMTDDVRAEYERRSPRASSSSKRRPTTTRSRSRHLRTRKETSSSSSR